LDDLVCRHASVCRLGPRLPFFLSFFFHDPAPTEIYTLSLHDALPISVRYVPASSETEIGGDFYAALRVPDGVLTAVGDVVGHSLDRKSTRLNSSHRTISYAVFCLKKKTKRYSIYYYPRLCTITLRKAS